MPLGTSVAAAIVTTCLFFGTLVGAVANFVYTKYPFYDVVIVSAAFRCVAYGCRAAYLSHFRPALEGVFLAFSNAGYGANVAVLYLAQASWCSNALLASMSAKELRFWKKLCFLLIIPIICFGPILGVIAAGYLFGDLNLHGQHVGQRLRAIATWGLWGCTMTFSLISARLFLASITNGGAGRKTADTAAAAAAAATGAGGEAALNSPQRRRQQQLVGILFTASLVMQVRALYNIVILYPAKKQLAADKYWYSLSVLPELLVMYTLVLPTLLARIALAWPRGLQLEAEAGAATGKGTGDSGSSRSGDGRPAIEVV